MAMRIVQRLQDKYSFSHIGAAVTHPEQGNVTMWNGIKIYPTSGFGDQMFLRQVIEREKPDLIWLFTDPRFFTWVWNMEDEIRDKIPIMYYHVWDNLPVPQYNKSWYQSCDFISCISSLTADIVKQYNIPHNINLHGIDKNEYFPLDQETREFNKKLVLGKRYDEDLFVVSWSNRNIKRKNPGDILYGFSKFNEKYPNSILIMHTDPIDNDGTDLFRVHRDLCPKANVFFSHEKKPPQYINMLYNISDVVVNIASNEGFGLTTCEALMAGVPIIVHLTGGLKDQIQGEDGMYTGIGIESSAKCLAGSPPTPYIYDDHVNVDDYILALEKMYLTPKEKRLELGKYCRQVAEKKFSIESMAKGIDEGFDYCFNNFKPRSPWVMRKM